MGGGISPLQKEYEYEGIPVYKAQETMFTLLAGGCPAPPHPVLYAYIEGATISARYEES